MTTPLPTGLPLLGTFGFLLLLTAFWWPALRLHLVMRRPEEARETAIALSFVTAFGVFSLVTGPLLLDHASTDLALAVVGFAWIVFAAFAEILARHVRTYPPAAATTTAAAASADSADSAEPPNADALLKQPPLSNLALLAVGLTAIAASFYARDVIPRRYGLLALCACAGLNGALLLLAWRRGNKPDPYGLRDQVVEIPSIWAGTDPAIARWLGWILLWAALASTPFFLRADADDNLYLSEALSLMHSDAMAEFAPTHRGEDLPANPMYGWQSFELWAAMQARLSGLHPLLVMRTLFAPLLLLLSLGLYRGLLRRVLPERLLPVATVFLLAYFVFGMSSQWIPNNYLLPRPQQGKTWLMHLGVAAIVLQSLRFLERPRIGTWVGVLLASFACLGWAPTAILLVPLLLATLGLTHLLIMRRPQALKPVLALGLCALPPLLFGMYLQADPEILNLEASLDWDESSPWTGLFFYQFLQGHSQGGGLELFLLCAAPLLLIGARRRSQAAYPGVFLIAMVAFTINPLLYGPVHDFTGDTAYLRFFWLLPLPVLLGYLGARVVQSLGARGFPGPLGLLLFLGLFPFFGTHWVWGTANLYEPEEEGIYLEIPGNLMKVPDDLLTVAEELRGLPLGPEHRILAHLNEVMHLAPLVLEFDFVYARNYQTLAPLLVLGREEEARRRERLGTEFLAGTMAIEEAGHLLHQEKAAYVVLGPWSELKDIDLRTLGYTRRIDEGSYSLWVSASVNAPMGSTSKESR